jgi:mRNA interferase MazF
MTRGELWIASGGAYASKPRPVLIIQEDHIATAESFTVVALTTHSTNAPALRIPVPASAVDGLPRDSEIMVDKITTIRRSHLAVRIGTLPRPLMVTVERAMMVFLGLAGRS